MYCVKGHIVKNILLISLLAASLQLLANKPVMPVNQTHIVMASSAVAALLLTALVALNNAPDQIIPFLR